MKVICLGGGSCIPKLTLAGFKERIDAGDDIQITAVTSAVDSGGSTGVLRDAENVLPPGDLRRHLLALSNAPDHIKEVLDTRINVELVKREEVDARHNAHSVFNMVLVSFEKNFGPEKGQELANEFMQTVGPCITGTLDLTHIWAKTESGKTIKGEDEIDRPVDHDVDDKIVEFWMDPLVDANPRYLQAIREADLIVFGPGDFYSSLVPMLMFKGVTDALKESNAKIVLVAPAMTKHGETDDWTVERFTEEFEKYTDGVKFTHILYNTLTDVPQERIDEYHKDEPYFLEMMKFGESTEDRYIGKPLLAESDDIIYNVRTVIDILIEIANY